MQTSSENPHPCMRCGACCAAFRVSLHWSEAAPELGGHVPIELTEPVRLHELAMRGTSQPAPRCIALEARIGRHAHCRIYPQRPQVCRDVMPAWENGHDNPQCNRARARYGLPPLQPQDWLTTTST